MVLRRRSMGEMKDLQQVQIRRGSRIDPGHADPVGSVAVLSAVGDTEEIRLDPFDAPKLYPRAARTEPGDVVFVEKPRPIARVDDRGGSLVASPSRILRLSPTAGIGPHAVAAIINQLPARSQRVASLECSGTRRRRGRPTRGCAHCGGRLRGVGALAAGRRTRPDQSNDRRSRRGRGDPQASKEQ